MSNSRSCTGSATMSIREIFRRETVSVRTLSSLPRGARMIPTAPSTSAACANWMLREKAIAPLAHFRAPRISLGAVRGSRAAAPRSGNARRWDRSLRRVRRTCRAARTRAAPPVPASRARRGARDRPIRPGALRSRGRSSLRGFRPAIPRAAPCASAGSRDTPVRRPSSAIPSGSRLHSYGSD
jgi:hypothetical protein